MYWRRPRRIGLGHAVRGPRQEGGVDRGARQDGAGGTCVNRGCIPTKALMASANLYASIKEAKAYGINVDMSAVSVDFKAINRRKNGVINNLSFGLETFCGKRCQRHRRGPRASRLVDPHTVEVDNGKEKKNLTAEYIVVAVGSERPRSQPSMSTTRRSSPPTRSWTSPARCRRA